MSLLLYCNHIFLISLQWFELVISLCLIGEARAGKSRNPDMTSSLPDPNPDYHQYLICWLLAQDQSLHKSSSTSVRNLLIYLVNRQTN